MTYPLAPRVALACMAAALFSVLVAVVVSSLAPDFGVVGPLLAGLAGAALSTAAVWAWMGKGPDKSGRDLLDKLAKALEDTGKQPAKASCVEDSVDCLLEALGEARRQCDSRASEARREAQRAVEALDDAKRARNSDRVRREGMVSAASTLEEVTQTLKTASKALSEEVRQVDEGADFQHGQVTASAQAMEDMAQAVVEVSKNASATSTVADNTRDQAGRGAEVVTRAVEAIDSVRARTQALKVRITGLGERAQSIGQVMGVISDIADQTNLLALNAAIEAARAGEAGRGFAVVADEVRKLAEKTMQATGEVGQVVRSIQEDIRLSVDEMGSAVQAVDSASHLGQESGKSLSEIVSLVDATTDQIRAIATAAEEQSAVGEEVRRSVERVRDVSEQTTAGMERASEAVQRLAKQVEELVKLSGVFRLIGDGKAQELVEGLAQDSAIRSLERSSMERRMQRAVDENAFLELVYITDGSGVQVTENIFAADFQGRENGSALGKDWSTRPWFSGALKNQGVYVSPIYVSTASNDYCLTISVPFFEGERMVGVVAADIKLFS